VYLNAPSWLALNYPGASNGNYGWQYELSKFYYSGIEGEKFALVITSGTTSFFWFANRGGWDRYNYMGAFRSGGGGNGNPVGNFWRTASWLQQWKFVRV
jgi:hypothetical protein